MWCGKRSSVSLLTVWTDWNFSFWKKRLHSAINIICCLKKTLIQSSKLLNFYLFRNMATLKNKRKLAAVSGDTQESARNGQSQNTFVPGMIEEYITQMSKEIEGRVTKKLSQEISRTESRVLGALSKLDEFLLNPQLRTYSGTVPGTSRNNDSETHWASFPEWSLSRNGVLCSSDREDTSHKSRLLTKHWNI